MVGRRGVSLMEVIIASLLVGACLAPMLAKIGRQANQAKWGRERLIAEQLASDVLEHLTERTYTWMRDTGDLNGAGAGGTGLNNQDYGWGAGNGWNVLGQRLQMHTIVGAMNWTDANLAWHRAPNAFNPALSGPGIGDTNINTVPWMDLGLDIDGVAPTTARNTFSNKYQFNREVEIFGGDSYTPPGMPDAANCYMVRVTVWTPQGSMKAPAFPGDSDGRYQVVTIIGDR